jgi:integrase
MAHVAGVLGLRFSEVAGLRVKRLDFLRRTLAIVETLAEVSGKLMFAEPKTKMSRRTLTVPPAIMEMLAEHLARRPGRVDQEDMVFISPEGGPVRRSTFRTRVWLPAVAKTGFEDVTFHSLRHTAAGFMIELGTHPRVMQQRLGHASIRTTMDVYGSVLPEVDAEVTRGLDQLLRPSRGLAAASTADRESIGSRNPLDFNVVCGGGEGSRTPDLFDATEAL